MQEVTIKCCAVLGNLMSFVCHFAIYCHHRSIPKEIFIFKVEGWKLYFFFLPIVLCTRPYLEKHNINFWEFCHHRWGSFTLCKYCIWLLLSAQRSPAPCSPDCFCSYKRCSSDHSAEFHSEESPPQSWVGDNQFIAAREVITGLCQESNMWSVITLANVWVQQKMQPCCTGLAFKTSAFGLESRGEKACIKIKLAKTLIFFP